MFIYSVTMTKEKTVLLLAIFLILLFLTGLLTVVPTARKNNELERRLYLEGCGIKTDTSPVCREKLKIPKNFDSMWEEYNHLQESQGFSLWEYRGKTVVKYTYSLPDDSESQKPLYANLLVWRDRVIAADITCPDFQNGFVKPLKQISEGVTNE